MLKHLRKEPFVHFLGFALAIFAAYGAINLFEARPSGSIVVTRSKIEQLAGNFTRTWQRSPTADELKHLVDDYVKDEVYYREAVALGLDKDDALIRRRLRLKMELLSQAEAEALEPTEAELAEFLSANSRKFAHEPMLAFRQIYLSPERRGIAIARDAAAILAALGKDAGHAESKLGDSTLLPSELPLTGKAAIGRIFGSEFANALDNEPPGQWSGPVKSAYGLHIVRIVERKPGRTAELNEVRAAVEREWLNAKRTEIERSRFARLSKRYDVRIESLAAEKSAP